MNSSKQQIYRFGDIEVDVSQGCIRMGGEERHLRQQGFQVLVYLLEQRERLVTKDQLLRAIWNETAVTDDALVQCVTDIRRALGDDSRHPRYVKTVPRIGYRFIGSVKAESPQNGPNCETEQETLIGVAYENESHGQQLVTNGVPLEGLVSDAEQRLTERVFDFLSRQRKMLVVASALIITMAVSWGVYVRTRTGVVHEESDVFLSPAIGKKSVAVVYFDNQSGADNLNWLREGLADMIITGLSRSKNLVVLSRQHLQVLLDRTGHKAPKSIQLHEALDIARQSHAELILMGSFATLGKQIRVDVQIYEARTSRMLTAERLVVDQPEQILTQIDLLSLKLASHLGAGSELTEAGPVGVMTSNLDAYRYYSLGLEEAQAFHNLEAIALFEKAIALDPDFAMAYARIGYTYAMGWGRLDEGKPYLKKAYQLSRQLTEKEKLHISAWYAIANLDYASALKSFREIVARYPLEVEAYRRLGDLLRGEERLEEAIEVYKQGLVIDSGDKLIYNALGSVYSELGRHDDAIAMFKRYVAVAPDEANAHDSLGLGYQWAGHYREAIQEYTRASELKPDFEMAVVHLANTYFQQGRYRDAIEKYRHYIKIAPSDAERGRGYGCIAHVQRIARKFKEAEKSAGLSQKYLGRGWEGLFLVSLERGDLQSEAKLKEVIEKFQYSGRGSRISLRSMSYYDAYFDLKNGRTDQAVEKFRKALSYRPLSWNIDAYEDCLANAYLELGRFDEAIAEYERILRLNPNYPLVHYRLAQAYEGKGQREQAHASYARFLEVWKDADQDIPEVIAANGVLGRRS